MIEKVLGDILFCHGVLLCWLNKSMVLFCCSCSENSHYNRLHVLYNHFLSTAYVTDWPLEHLPHFPPTSGPSYSVSVSRSPEGRPSIATAQSTSCSLHSLSVSMSHRGISSLCQIRACQGRKTVSGSEWRSGAGGGPQGWTLPLIRWWRKRRGRPCQALGCWCTVTGCCFYAAPADLVSWPGSWRRWLGWGPGAGAPRLGAVSLF